MFTLDDLMHSEVGKETHELFESEIASLEFGSAEVASKMFPGVKLAESANVCYFPYKLCHSLPTVNARGRCFSAPVLANSFSTLVDQLIDIEHELANHDPNQQDRIGGFTKAVKFVLPAGFEIGSELPVEPDSPFPVYGLGCLFRRAQDIEDIIKQHNSSKQKWSVSMECSHDWPDAYLRYRGDYIPIADAEDGMLECIKRSTVKAYKGHELAVMLGGLNGKVDFWGTGLTTSPAEKTATIPSKVFRLVGGVSNDVASTMKKFYMPMQLQAFGSSEAANTSLPNDIKEIASTGVIGETEPAADGHKHYVLSDMTIFPTNGHDHCMRAISISRGSSPTLSAYSSTRTVWGRDGMPDVSHAHMIRIPLKGKFNQGGKPDDTDDTSELTLPITDTALASTGDEDMKKTLNELMESLRGCIASLQTEKDATKLGLINLEIANIQKDINEQQSEANIAAIVDQKIAERITSGVLLTKEKANELVAAAVTEEEQKHQEVERQLGVKADRLKSINELGIDTLYQMPGMVNDGNPVTVGGYVETLGFDDAGDMQYKTLVSLLSANPAAKKIPAAEGAEAASKGGKPAGKTAAKPAGKEVASKKTDLDIKKLLATAGGGSVESEEEASEHGFTKPAKDTPRHLMGVHGFSDNS